MTAIELDDPSVQGDSERDLRLGWYAEMPEGTLAAYDEPLDTTLKVADKMASLPTSPNPSGES